MADTRQDILGFIQRRSIHSTKTAPGNEKVEVTEKEKGWLPRKTRKKAIAEFSLFYLSEFLSQVEKIKKWH